GPGAAAAGAGPSARTGPPAGRCTTGRWRCGGGCSYDFQVGHHAGVGVLEVVAVEHVLAAVAGEGDGEPDPALRHEDGVLQAGVLRERRTPVPADHPEVRQVEVDRMVGVGGDVPDLGGVQRHLRVDASAVELPEVDH